jgi:RNA polymerase sigma-70 factor (ECF subfamily)
MNGERTAATDDDSRLVARFLRGDAAAFDALFRKYQDYVYHILYGVVGSPEEARDLTQDVFVQVYRSLPKFRHGARFATWLYRIAVNRALDAARSSRRWRFLPIPEEFVLGAHAAVSEEEPEALFARGLEQEAVQKTLLRCPMTHRVVLALRYYRELSLEEIAETLDCSVAAAKVRLHRARQVFKTQYLAVYGTEEPGASKEEAHVTPTAR